ncbi:MAG: HAMP domain-containing histidine kinase [Nitrospinae bacterium]|nr:HAMP domain-containing histidine kinase [Nitrospinota bacterium]
MPSSAGTTPAEPTLTATHYHPYGDCKNKCCRELMDRADRALSSLSHDLKSPMVAIVGFSRILSEEIGREAPNGRWLDMMKRVENAAIGALSMVEDILAMTKMEAGKEPVELEWVLDMERELEDVMDTFRMEAEARRIQLKLDIALMPPVRWDMRRIRYHAVNNILSNALKFTPTGGRVTLSARAEGGKALIIIEDTGPGVPVAEREKIFHRFEQGDLGSERVLKGSGLGLANARLFTQRHGGVISVGDASPHGARFSLELPIDAAGLTA